jgi:ATP-dependent Clp protease ATP-binding subunit ClpB
LFSPLTKEQIKGIIGLTVNDIRERLEEKDISLELTDAALNLIADEAYDPHYGARPIKRYLTKHVETRIAGDIVRGNIVDGDNVVCDAEDGVLVFRTENRAE